MTRTTGTTSISTNWGTSSSGFGADNYEEPKDLSDIAGLEAEIPRGNNPSSSARTPSRPSGGGGIDLSKPGPAPFEGLEPKRAPGRSPIGLEIGKSAGGGLGVGIAIPIGGPISARGGVNIGKDGAIKGGQVGLGLGAGPIGASIDVGTDQDEQGRGGCYQYVTFSLGPFSHTYGRNVCKSESPTPTPTPILAPKPFPQPPLPPNGGSNYCTVVVVKEDSIWIVEGEKVIEYAFNTSEGIAYKDADGALTVFASGNYKSRNRSGVEQDYDYPLKEVPQTWYFTNKYNYFGYSSVFGASGPEGEIYKLINTYHGYDVRNYAYSKSYHAYTYKIIYSDCPLSVFPPSSSSPSSPSPSPSPSVPPNSPIKKNMDKKCCQILALYHQEQLRLMGRPLGPQGQLIPIPENTYFNTEVERIKTPVENSKEPEKEIIKFNNFYELLMYSLSQQVNLDIAIDPKSFVAPAGKLQNPAYQRDSEQSLESNNQPDTDKLGNKRELEIGNEIKINSLSQQQQYIFEALKRLEYLFPSGELSDANFKKSLIIPGAEGKLKIHNLIHFQEFLVQYLNATLGNPKIPIKIEDTNAIKEGNQSATFNHFSISHMIREVYKLILESGDDINTIMETTVRNFRTNLANRIQIVQVAEMVQALVQDSGMLESQEFIPLKLEGDPYAGKWKPGMGFEPDGDLDSNEEKATEKLLKATLKNFQAEVKVVRRDNRENADLRDLLLQLSEMFIRSTSIPATKEGIEKALAIAKYKVKVDNALSRTQVKRAAAAKLSRTKKRNK
jgi:hypothetical protein